MKQLNSSFIVSSSGKDSWPELDKPEVVVVGRSNVGKSSFINALTNRKRLAYVGKTPGKTQLLNFFDIDGEWTLVDVPGYGYAKLSKNQLEKLGKMMDDYFNDRQGIAAVISLVDARHDPSRDDLDMIQYFKDNGFKILVGATKIDKVPKTKRLAHLKKISQQLQLPLKNIFPISSTEKTGMDEIYGALMEIVKSESETDKNGKEE
ncbi:MAG: YihA family ribosome biogenesis GTP-binding protein [Ileibacterium sp.]|nr:YihA family ribosome biogenesis GTP-binding protein [Ileibacterium sp.]